ncbi:MAG TPA: hypothetical protein VFW52_01345 [Candidatus Saccharimonadales bacterium]|nr:hypothetical protein [Candidatus Saccharimonadales bacterium]
MSEAFKIDTSFEGYDEADLEPDILKIRPVTGGRYRPARVDVQRRRIDDIDQLNEPGIRFIEYAMYALEMAGKIRSRYEIDSTEQTELSGEEARKVLEEEDIAHLMQYKVEDAYSIASTYDSIAIERLRTLTSDYTENNTAALKAIGMLDRKNLIGPGTKRTTESIIRVMIANQIGAADQLPAPKPPVEPVQ